MADKAHSAGNPACNTNMPETQAGESKRHSGILPAFAAWQTHHAARRALPYTGAPQDDEIYNVDERALWDAIDKAENQIIKSLATTPAEAACKLWVAIPHNTTDADPEYAALRADLAWFESEGDALDWNVRCIVSALVSLKSMEG